MRARDLQVLFLKLKEDNLAAETENLINRYLIYKEEIKNVFFSYNMTRDYKTNYLEKHFPEYYSPKAFEFEIIDKPSSDNIIETTSKNDDKINENNNTLDMNTESSEIFYDCKSFSDFEFKLENFKSLDSSDYIKFDNLLKKQLNQIDKDIDRFNPSTIEKENSKILINLKPIVRNILYLYECAGKNEFYTQGMDSILYPFLNIFIQEEYEKEEDLLKIEVYSFLCFIKILYVLEDDIKNTFLNELIEIHKDLKKEDPILYKHIDDNNLIFSGIYIKWMIPLYSRDFQKNLNIWYHIFEKLFLPSVFMAKINLIYFTYYLMQTEREELLKINENFKAAEILEKIPNKLSLEDIDKILYKVINKTKTNITFYE